MIFHTRKFEKFFWFNECLKFLSFINFSKRILKEFFFKSLICSSKWAFNQPEEEKVLPQLGKQHLWNNLYLTFSK